MRAITLWPEWAWAITALDKRVENRPECIARMLARYDGVLAIHAGKHVGGRPGKPAAFDGLTAVAKAVRGGPWYYADGNLSSVVFHRFGGGRVVLDQRKVPTSAIVATCRTGRLLPPGEAAPWKVTEGWAVKLSDVRPLAAPLPCGGHQGLWTVPDDLAAAIRIELDPAPTERT